MPLYNFECKACGHRETRAIYQEDDLTWREQIFVRGPTKAQLAKMDFDKGDDPRDYEVYKEVNYGKELPEKVKCGKCKKKKAEFYVENAPSIKHGRNSYQAMKERQRYNLEGMDKAQAEQFYKESIEASKDRIKKGGDSHYKKIVPHYPTLEKEGLVKRRNDQQTAEKVEALKRANQHLTKDGTIGKGPRKKR